jgi:GDP-mannose 6-dehydrogenase
VSADGEADLRAVLAVVTEIARVFRGAGRAHVAAVRSTLPPGAMRSEVIPAFLHALGGPQDNIFLCYYPEFMREGSGVKDFLEPSLVPVGCGDGRAVQALQALYNGWGPRLEATSVENAELVKCSANAWHALKVAFANEIGSIAAASGADGQETMRILSQDRVLNISPAYLKPGFAFGGSCLPKDLRLLSAYAGCREIQTPVLDNILVSNDRHLERLTQLVAGAQVRRALILGLTFKAGTDDVRESAAVRLAARLAQAGVEIRIFDPDVRLERLFGANLTFLENELPEFQLLLLNEVELKPAEYDALVVTTNKPAFSRILAARRPEQKLFHFAHDGEE